MKVFHLKYQDVFFNEAVIEEIVHINLYEKLFISLLDFRHVSGNRYCEVANVSTGRIRSKTFDTERALLKKNLPPFQFLLFRN
jgi:hypothetical protein